MLSNLTKPMKYLRQFSAFAIVTSVCLAASSLLAAEAKTYQVTGPVIEITATTITVDKNGEKHQIARDKSTKGPSNIKIGDKVTVYYRMMATEVEVKTAPKNN